MTSDHPSRFTRRAVLGMLFAAGASACSPSTGRSTAERTTTPAARSPGTATAGTSATHSTPSPSPSPSPEVATLAPVDLYETIEGETYPNAKRIAGRFVQALTTYDLGATPHEIVRGGARAADRGFDADAVVVRARPLLRRGAASRGEIVYPQLGGLTQDGEVERCCVMVVVRQTLLEDDREQRSVTRTLDVRLVNRDDEWRIEDLADAGGRPVRRRDKQLAPIARRVLDNNRIDLPDSARWDIHAGIVDERLLRTMHRIAQVAPYSVCTLRNGHPVNVFGSDRTSNHTLGRAVDIWAVDGQPVVVQAGDEDTPAHELTSTLLDRHRVTELGSPWDLDGPPSPGQTRPSFTDAVHADHIHAAYRST